MELNKINSNIFTAKFPIRYKILALVLSITVLTSVLNIFFSSRLILEDKTAYLYDYIMTQAKMTSVVLDKALIGRSEPEEAIQGYTKEDLQLENTSSTAVAILDSNGRSLFSSTEDTKKLLAGPGGESLIKSILSAQFKSGAKSWKLQKNDEYIVAYSRTQDSRFVVVTMIRSEIAFLAKKILLFQTLLFSLCILSIAIGAALLLAKTLTSKISDLAHATEVISEGKFDVQIKSIKGNDEISSLGKAFQVMIAKIQELLVKTAETARMEKELVTAKLVQESFFPQENFENEKIKVAGYFEPATECSGDWWYCTQKNGKTLVLVGDVTGHGASAALVTASVFSSYNLFMEMEDLKTNPETVIKKLMGVLNRSVYASGSGNSSMTMIAALIDNESGDTFLANCSHRPPYLIAAGEPTAKSLTLGKSDQLGSKKDIEVAVSKMNFKNQTLVFISDGILETAGVAPAPLGSKGFIKILNEVSQKNVSTVKVLKEEILFKVQNHIGKNLAQKDDDLTFVVCKL